MKGFWKIFREFILPYKGYALLNLVLNLFGVIFSLFSLVLIGPFLKVLFNAQEILTEPVAWEFSKTAIEHNFNYFLGQQIAGYGPHKALMIVSMLILVMFLLKTGNIFLANYFMAPIRNGVVRDIRNKIYQKTLTLPISYLSDEKKGDIMSRVTQDVQEIEWSVMASLEKFLRDPLNILIFLAGLLIMSPGLTLFVLILLPVSALIIGQIGKNLRKSSARAQSQMGHLMSFLEESLTGLRIIKSFNAEKKMKSGFSGLNDGFTQSMNAITRRRYLASPLSEFLGSIVIVVLLIYGGNLVLGGSESLTAASFMAYIAIFSQLLSPAKSFSTAFYHVQKGLASWDRIDQILQVQNPVKDPADPVSIQTFKDSIVYNNVTFSYTESPVLKNISLTIRKGQTIALVGQSGSGKSTFADLLMRFYDVDSGAISIDGTDIRAMRLNDLRRLTGYVHQEPLLFNDSFAQNIAFGSEQPDLEKVRLVARAALAEEFIQERREGLHFMIGDRGNKLSGGQKQRISIARALYADPQILILDEATSALDSESERLVQAALNQLMKGRTTVIIAHRLSTIIHADQIVVFKEGEIVEAGNHEELLAQKGEYLRIYQQSKESDLHGTQTDG